MVNLQSDELLRRASTLMDTALDLDSHERRAWLSTIKLTEPDVAPHLERLLDAHSRIEQFQFLDQTIDYGAIDQPLNATHDERTRSLRQIGSHRLIRQIGSGGMSVVWLAEKPFEGVKQQVAIKLLSAHLQGEEHKKRLGREASILAQLNHPNIAKLFDAGYAETGEPYLVLEYIDGEPITSYCDRLQMSLKARIELTLQVCAAVNFLHRYSVVHRDIKPNNVLVDQSGQVKLLDFGISKLLDRESISSQETMLTVNAMTPEYASPEQIQGLPITTATDIYSLGVLLFRLLTGLLPYGRNAPALLVPSIIVSDEPSKPSDLFEKALDTIAPVDLVKIVQSRQSSARQLHINLRNDLDNVLLKALEKDVDRRYSSVEAFASDLRAYLSNHPIQAKPATKLYIVQKFVERHRVAVMLGALSIVGICIATASAFWQAREAREEAIKTKRVLSFLQTLIAEASPNNTGIDTISVLDLLQRAPKVAQRQFPNEPELQFEVLKPVERLLRDLESASALEPVESEMVKLLSSVNLPAAEESELRTEYALTLAYLGKQEQANKAVDEAISKLEQKGQRNTIAYSKALMIKAVMFAYQRNYGEAANLGKRSHQMLSELVKPSDPLITQSAQALIDILLNAEQLKDAQAIAQRDFTSERFANLPLKEQISYRSLQASLALQLGNPVLADQLYDALIPDAKQFFGDKNPMYVRTTTEAGRAAVEAGHYEKAIRYYQASESFEKTLSPIDSPTLFRVLCLSAMAHLHVQQFNQAREKLLAADSLITQGTKSTQTYWKAKFWLAFLEGDVSNANTAILNRIQMLQTSPQSLNMIDAQLDYAMSLTKNDLGKALELSANATDTLKKKVPESHISIHRAVLIKAHMLAQDGKPDEAAKLIRAGLKEITTQLGSQHPLAIQEQAWLNNSAKIKSPLPVLR